MAETECELFQSRVLLRVAKIIEVKRHPNADKLYIETISLGDEERQIVSGLVPYYSKEDLVGKHIILVANLKPAKLRGIESNGMLLAAEAGNIVEVICVDEVNPGERITLEGYEESVKGNPEEITIDEFFAIPIKVKGHHLYVGNSVLVSKEGPVKTVKVKDGRVT
jgi:methionyl-tRNA synthetase